MMPVELSATIHAVPSKPSQQSTFHGSGTWKYVDLENEDLSLGKMASVRIEESNEMSSINEQQPHTAARVTVSSCALQNPFPNMQAHNRAFACP
jgi:hypothetical protein